jgi:hypothetical protein
MSSKFLHEAQRGASRGSIDLPLAIVAGLAVGFVAFVMPADILSRAVEISRLPEILPAAAPPLGARAHAAFAAAAAGVTVAAIYFLLRLLGRKGPEPKARDWPETEREPEAPRLRRSDVHPDAPARRPILAARELGEPDPAPVEEPSAEPAAAAPEEEALELGGPGIEMLAAPEEPIVAEPIPEPPAAQPAPKPRSLDTVSEASIPDLMARLERGLARRLHRQSEIAAPAEAPRPPATNDPGDDRLRSAIENLQKMAARAG